jgi:hypothetical protein
MNLEIGYCKESTGEYFVDLLDPGTSYFGPCDYVTLSVGRSKKEAQFAAVTALKILIDRIEEDME